jgi:hypothetical protein
MVGAITKFNSRSSRPSTHLLIGLLVLEFGVERGPDLGLGKGDVVHFEVPAGLEEARARKLPARSTALLRRGRRGGR